MTQIIVSTRNQEPLSAKERMAIDHERTIYPDNGGVCIEALRIVQKNRGWVSDGAVTAIAEYLNLSTAEIDSVATFYDLIYRRPVGVNVIKLCDSVCCWIRGGDNLQQKITDKLGINWGETTGDKVFTLLPANCLGDCDRAPVMMINEDHYSDVDDKKMDVILDELAGQGSNG